jgi:hypothetical protein
MEAFVEFDTGAKLPLRPTIAKSGNRFLAVRPKNEPRLTQYGVNVSIAEIGGKLPSRVRLVVDGQASDWAALVSGETISGNPKVSTADGGKILFDEVEQTLRARVSQPDKTRANLHILTARHRSSAVSSVL